MSKKNIEKNEACKTKLTREYLENESAHDRWVRVSKPVIKLVFIKLGRIQHLVTSNRYEPNSAEVNNLCELLMTKIQKIRDSYNPNKDTKKSVDLIDAEIDSIFE